MFHPNSQQAGSHRLSHWRLRWSGPSVKDSSACVDDTGDFGPDGSPTRRALINFKTAQALKIENATQLMALTKAIRDTQSCKVEALANSLESGIVSWFGEDGVRTRIKRAIDSVNNRVTEKMTPPPELTSRPLARAAINTRSMRL